MDLPVGVRSFENNSIDYSWSIDCIESPDRGMHIAKVYDCRRYCMLYEIEVAKVGQRIKVVKFGRQIGISSAVKVGRRIGIIRVWTRQTVFLDWCGRIRHPRRFKRRMWRRGWNCEWGWWRNGRGRPARTEWRGDIMVVSKLTVGEPVRKQWQISAKSTLGTPRGTWNHRNFACWQLGSEGGACTSWIPGMGDAIPITGVLTFLTFLTFLSLTLSKGIFTSNLMSKIVGPISRFFEIGFFPKMEKIGLWPLPQGITGWHDDDGEGWHGDLMMLVLHLMVDCQFMIMIIYLDTVFLLWLFSSANFPQMCTKASLMLLCDCWIICMNLYSYVVDKERLFIELMHISKDSDILSWRWTFLVAVFFAVIFFDSYISLLFAATCLHCDTLTLVRWITEVELGFLPVLAY